MKKEASVRILGARGSIPVGGEAFRRYGGATTCVMVRLAGQIIVLDAGTGLLSLSDYLKKDEKQISLLLSHPHADHLLGLPLCSLMLQPDFYLDVYAAQRGSLNAEGQVQRFMSPPLWPVKPENLPARLTFYDLPQRMELGDVVVETMEGVHSGGVTLFRLTGDGHRVVFATDCTLADGLLPKLRGFAKDCDLLLCDGQYSEAEWSKRSAFGHSTWMAAARLGKDCGAKQVRIIHHDPFRTDRQLREAAAEVEGIHSRCSFAYEGEEVLL